MDETLSSWLQCRQKNQLRAKEFLAWAKEDIKDAGQRRRSNALTNAKRAIHCQVAELVTLTRLRWANGWPDRESTELMVKLLKALGLPYSVPRSVTLARNELEHGYILPAADSVRTHVEATEMWLARIEEARRPAVVLAGLPVSMLGTGSRGVSGTFEGNGKVEFFWDAKRMLVALDTQGHRKETHYADVKWQDLLQMQRRHWERGWSCVDPSQARQIFRAYERWVSGKGNGRFQYANRKKA